MAQGLKLPLATKNGRLIKLSGDDYIQQTIVTAFLGSDSDNPFQQIGLGEEMIFDLNDEETAGKIKAKVLLIFDGFENDQLAKLENPEQDVTFTIDGANQYMSISYINIETQERQEFDVPLSGE